MKKLIILAILSFSLVSCFNETTIKNQDNNTWSINELSNSWVIDNEEDMEVSTNSWTIDSSSWTIESNSWTIIEQEIIDELSQVTRDNFEPIILNLSEIDNSQLDSFDCNAYFYLPEPENRPKFQLDIQKEYIEKCENIIDEKKLSFYNEQIQSNPEDLFEIKDDYKEEYNSFLSSISWVNYNEFIQEIKAIWIRVSISEAEYNSWVTISYSDYEEAKISNINKMKQNFLDKQKEYKEWINNYNNK